MHYLAKAVVRVIVTLAPVGRIIRNGGQAVNSGKYYMRVTARLKFFLWKIKLDKGCLTGK